VAVQRVSRISRKLSALSCPPSAQDKEKSLSALFAERRRIEKGFAYSELDRVFEFRRRTEGIVCLDTTRISVLSRRNPVIYVD